MARWVDPYVEQLLRSSDVRVYNLRGRYLRTENGRSWPHGEKRLADCLKPYLGEPKWHVRPEWLKNPRTGKSLELDLFYPTVLFAAEFNGNLHVTKSASFRDAVKAMQCWNHKVALLVVRPHEVKELKRKAYWRGRINRALEILALPWYGKKLLREYERAGIAVGYLEPLLRYVVAGVKAQALGLTR